jgi:hypothetical protein
MGRYARFAACLLVLLGGRPATAYVRSVTKAGAFYHWNRTDLGIEAYVGGQAPGLDPNQRLEAIRKAAAPWTHDRLSCSAIEIAVQGRPEATAQVKRDGINRLVFRRQEWCPDPREPDEPCYTSQTLALTTNTTIVKTGEIVEADMEVNAVDYVWANLMDQPGAGPTARDLQNALTHEFGHFLGFAHSCILSTSDTARIDDQGQPVASCGAESPTAHESTMLPEIGPTDLDRRTLTEDDQRGVCDLYPVPIVREQTEVEAGGCALASRRPQGWAWLLVAFVPLVRRRFLVSVISEPRSFHLKS